jgi:hypothetical protein
VAVWPVTSWSSARQTAPTRSGPARHRSASSIGSGLPQAFGYPPLEPLAGNWRTWNIRDGSQFRPFPPPAYGSPQFLAEMREGWSVSQTLTEEQKRIADYWADGAGTVTPPGHWNQIALDQLASSGWSTLQATRLPAALNTAQADAFIACWDAKYAYWSLRPVTAIRRVIDSNWLSYMVTPPFPSYVSGHSTTSGAAATVLWVSSPVAPASSRRWPRRQPSHDSTAASTTAPTTWWDSSSHERWARSPWASVAKS